MRWPSSACPWWSPAVLLPPLLPHGDEAAIAEELVPRPLVPVPRSVRIVWATLPANHLRALQRNLNWRSLFTNACDLSSCDSLELFGRWSYVSVGHPSWSWVRQNRVSRRKSPSTLFTYDRKHLGVQSKQFESPLTIHNWIYALTLSVVTTRHISHKQNFSAWELHPQQSACFCFLEASLFFSLALGMLLRQEHHWKSRLGPRAIICLSGWGVLPGEWCSGQIV